MSSAMNVKNSLFNHLVTVAIIHCLLASSSSTAETNETTDQYALLTLKARIISDPYGVMENWTIPSSFCHWIGVTCGIRHHRVTALNISNMAFIGSIPPEIGNLPFLTSIDIRSNDFGGTLPEDMARLRRLRFIRLSQNSFTGDVPSWFSSFPQLQLLSIWNNSFTSLNSFLISSTNESRLTALDVSLNPFQGEIPESIGKLRNLKTLIMQGNGFSGSLHPSIGNLSSLETLELSDNFFQGMIPETIGNLYKLKWLNLQNNQLNSSIPVGIFNGSMLEVLSLYNNSLSGILPSNLCLRLPIIKTLHLSNNQIGGQIPSNLSSCHHLQMLSLSKNRITGTIPKEIGSAEMLEKLYLGDNNLTGSIPPDIGKLGNLQGLALERNLLSGAIPLTMFNLSFLQELNLYRNNFSGFLVDNFGNLTKLKSLILAQNSFTGVIPQVFHKLTDLEILILEINRLSGPLPSSIFNISTLKMISLSVNSLSGNLPTPLGTFLPRLERLILGGNNLHGVLPTSISNSTQLRRLDLDSNKLTGTIPTSLGDLKFLETLLLLNNNFSIPPASSELSFITSLTSCKFLTQLDVSYNPLNVVLPISVRNLSSSLQDFYASGCKIKGSIPNEFGNLSRLVRLYLDGNDLTGVIPSELKLSNLQVLALGDNRLTGFIPNDLCRFKYLGGLYLSQNQLRGSIPKCLGNISSLRYIKLDSNNLTSIVPASIWNLQDLLQFNISSNSFTGSLSPQIGNLKAAVSIDMSMNQFSNSIPNTFASLESVSYLSLAHNRFQGHIPDTMGSMLSLNSLDLSYNMLSGTIPQSLESLTLLKYFNVSFNELTGKIPTDGPFKNFTSQSFLFNLALCGPSRFQVSFCQEPPHRSKKKKIFQVVFLVLGVATLMFIGTIAFLMVRYCSKKKSPTVQNTLDITKPQRMSYYELLKATDGYNESNLLGRGSFGSVYKGVLEDGTILAIKVFNMLLEVASNTFDTECDALRNLRHRNLIKVVGSCSNEDFKAIVLKYMPNGSLEQWLYSTNHYLDMMQRLNTMIDVANALEYLHYGYLTSVVHCDVKPSNVLMDENMVAHVSDFGIMKFLGEEESITHTRTLATLGYMAPEYGLDGIVSPKCDVYSYGIMLLETFTRKRPSDEMFHRDMNLKTWVKNSLPDALSHVIDAGLIDPEETNINEKLWCASSIMELGLKCSADSPGDRINMNDVLAELHKIKAKFTLHHPGASNKYAMIES